MRGRMAKKVTVRSFIQDVKKQRAALEDIIASCDQETLTRAGVAGEWSIKDILAHITWFDREMVGILQAKAFVSSDLWSLPPDDRNAAIHEGIKTYAWEKVQKEAAEVYKDLLEGLADLRDDDLHDPAAFPGMPPDWTPWEVMAENTYEHYQEHLVSILAWLKKQ